MKFKFKLLILFLFVILSLILSGYSSISEEQLIVIREDLELEITELEAELLTVKDKVENIEKEILSQRTVNPSPLINEYQSKISELNAELTEKLVMYREKHPEIVKLKNRIDYWDKKIEEESTKNTESRTYSKNPVYMELLSSKNKIDTKISGLKAKLTKINSDIISIQKSKIEEINVSVPANEVEANQKNSLIPFLEILTFSILIVLIISGVFFGVIKIYKMYFKKNKKKIDLTGVLNKVSEVNAVANLSDDIFLFHEPDHKEKSSIREICQNIEGRTRAVVFSGLANSSGKTFVAVNSACFWAISGKKTLIMDLCFENPKIHRLFMSENDIGVSDILSGYDGNVVKTSIVNNLDYIVAGHKPVGIEELLESTMFLDYIKNMEDKYDRIVIDTPSINSETTALVISKYIPMVVVINSEKEVREAELKSAQSSSVYLGSVLNNK
ncbi:MAG: hypothetical protein WC002_06455 [Candidatus Muiribacteriota bacterium]